MLLLTLFDLALVLGLALRLTRLIVLDDVGLWLVRGPAYVWASDRDPRAVGWRAKLVSGLTCPFCIGFWIGCLALLSLALVGGPGSAWEPWRWVAGAFTLNWIAAHLGARMGDS